MIMVVNAWLQTILRWLHDIVIEAELNAAEYKYTIYTSRRKIISSEGIGLHQTSHPLRFV